MAVKTGIKGKGRLERDRQYKARKGKIRRQKLSGKPVAGRHRTSGKAYQDGKQQPWMDHQRGANLNSIKWIHFNYLLGIVYIWKSIKPCKLYDSLMKSKSNESVSLDPSSFSKNRPLPVANLFLEFWPGLLPDTWTYSWLPFHKYLPSLTSSHRALSSIRGHLFSLFPSICPSFP